MSCPFVERSLSHLVLFDVFHHLRAPNAFLREARRVLTPSGRLILFEPYISWTSLARVWTASSRGARVAAADQPARPVAAAPRLLHGARQRHAAVLPPGDSRLAARLGRISRGGVQLLSLPALGRLRQTGYIPGAPVGSLPETRCHALPLAQAVRGPLPGRPEPGTDASLTIKLAAQATGLRPAYLTAKSAKPPRLNRGISHRRAGSAGMLPAYAFLNFNPALTNPTGGA